jgi:peptidoglycan/xylan/chitin deacetylase (PgdA/CDA1 family)
VDWFQQLSGIFAAFARYLWLAVILALCLVGDLEFHWIWWVFLPLFFIAVQVKHALRIPHRDRADLIYAFLIVPAEAFAWLRAGWFTAAWLQAPFALLIGKRKDRWQAQYRAEAFKRSLIGRLRLLGLRFAALTVMSAIVMLSAGNLYPASGLPTVASVSKVGLAESLNKSVPSRCAGYVALTYDDGPTEFTRATSALLHRYRLHASFFLTGEQVEQNRQTVHSLAANGHQVGVHAGRLRDSTNFPLTHFRAEIGRTSKLIEDTTGHRPALFRPAYGQSSDAISKLVAKQKMSEVLWTLDTSDSSGKSVSEIDEAISSAKDGDIILMHENGDSAMKAVPLIAATLRRHNLCTGGVVADLAGRNIPHVVQSHYIKVAPLVKTRTLEEEVTR